MRVRRAPAEVEFRVDGRRIDAHTTDSSWREAVRVVPLAAGLHTVEARFTVGRFEGERLWSTITTVDAVRIAPGHRTLLEADLQGTRTDPPEERVHYFDVTEPPLAVAATDDEHTTRAVPIEPAAASNGAPGYGSHEWERTIRAEPSVPLVLAPPARTVEDTAEPAHTVVVSLEVVSVPEGALVRIDDAEVGRTPLRHRIDPRRDHMLQVEREGCSPIVQLLSADAWRAGRTPKVSLQLDCR